MCKDFLLFLRMFKTEIWSRIRSKNAYQNVIQNIKYVIAFLLYQGKLYQFCRKTNKIIKNTQTMTVDLQSSVYCIVYTQTYLITH